MEVVAVPFLHEADFRRDRPGPLLQLQHFDGVGVCVFAVAREAVADSDLGGAVVE